MAALDLFFDLDYDSDGDRGAGHKRARKEGDMDASAPSKRSREAQGDMSSPPPPHLQQQQQHQHQHLQQQPPPPTDVFRGSDTFQFLDQPLVLDDSVTLEAGHGGGGYGGEESMLQAARPLEGVGRSGLPPGGPPSHAPLNVPSWGEGEGRSADFPTTNLHHLRLELEGLARQAPALTHFQLLDTITTNAADEHSQYVSVVLELGHTTLLCDLDILYYDFLPGDPDLQAPPLGLGGGGVALLSLRLLTANEGLQDLVAQVQERLRAQLGIGARRVALTHVLRSALVHLGERA
jgi:hypothetical protein